MDDEEEHDEKVAEKVKAAEETTAAFSDSNFRARRERAAANPDALGDVNPSESPVAAAVPAAVSKADLLTLEERVSRIERILDANNIGEDGWLNEG